MDRPIVNEYLEILWICISRLAPNLERKSRKFRINLSHDVDRPNFAHSNNKSLKVYDDEPLAHYSKLLDFAEEHNIQSAFYFLSAVTEPKLDADYTLDDKEIEMLLKLINANGHEIGFPPKLPHIRRSRSNNERMATIERKMRSIKHNPKNLGRKATLSQIQNTHNMEQLGISRTRLRLDIGLPRASRFPVRYLL